MTKKENDGTSMERAYMEKKIKMVASKSGKEPKQTITKMYPNLFKDLEKIEPEDPIKLKKDISLKVHPSRKICASSWAKIRKIKEELDRMEKADDHVIRKIDESTECIKSIVVVVKPSGRLIICLDPRDLNKAVERVDYQLPIFEEITSRLNGVKMFTKLDPNRGYWQIPLDEESIRLTTFSKPFRMYQFTRLLYAVHSAQEVFRKRINQSFDSISQVETDINDMLI